VSFEPSPARQGLNLLLRAYPHFDVVDVVWQGEGAPWVLVSLGQPGEGDVQAWAVWSFAIFKRTGAVHTMRAPAGPVSDDPIFAPTTREAK
jgi:hypothetical protein